MAVASGRAVHDPVFRHRYPMTCCVLVREAWCEAPGERSPWALAQERLTARSRQLCEHQGGRELGSGHMVSTCKPLQRRYARTSRRWFGAWTKG